MRSGKPTIWMAVFVLSILLLLAALSVAGYKILYQIGENSMLDYDNVKLSFSEGDGKTVRYLGQDYRLNEKVTTVLLIGVDRRSIDGGETFGNGGEADCVMLLSMDTETGETTILNLSRETYAEVDIYSADGKFLETRSTQLCRAYAYGDGGTLSCENTVKSVERLLYGLPIHSYVAMDTRFIGAAANAVDGVTLTALSDVEMPDKSILFAGQEVTLRGKSAERYVRYRDKQLLSSNQIRMERQKQFAEQFLQKALQQTKGDLTTILELYQAMSAYMTTDLDLADVTFLLSSFLDHGASLSFRSVEGTQDILDINAVYYLDETNLYETLLDIYYIPIETENNCPTS